MISDVLNCAVEIAKCVQEGNTVVLQVCYEKGYRIKGTGAHPGKP